MFSNNSTFVQSSKFFKNHFSSILKTFFIGFILGNIFGSFLSLITWTRGGNVWIVVGMIVIFEMIAKVRLRKKKHSQLKNQIICFQTGILIGFFIDAFKVGS